jgi:hypothetical protein
MLIKAFALGSQLVSWETDWKWNKLNKVVFYFCSVISQTIFCYSQMYTFIRTATWQVCKFYWINLGTNKNFSCQRDNFELATKYLVQFDFSTLPDFFPYSFSLFHAPIAFLFIQFQFSESVHFSYAMMNRIWLSHLKTAAKLFSGWIDIKLTLHENSFEIGENRG